MFVSKYFFLGFSIMAIIMTFLNNPGTIGAVGSVIAMIISFVGHAITERLDKLIKYQEKIKENTRIIL